MTKFEISIKLRAEDEQALFVWLCALDEAGIIFDTDGFSINEIQFEEVQS